MTNEEYLDYAYNVKVLSDQVANIQKQIDAICNLPRGQGQLEELRELRSRYITVVHQRNEAVISYGMATRLMEMEIDGL